MKKPKISEDELKQHENEVNELNRIGELRKQEIIDQIYSQGNNLFEETETKKIKKSFFRKILDFLN